MLYKSKQPLLLLVILCIVGSTITTFIVADILHFHFIISTLFFLCFSAFLIRLVYYGNIRSILCEDKNMTIHYANRKCIPYKDIQAVYIKADVPRRVNSKRSYRRMDTVVILNNNEQITIPHASFLNDIYDIIQCIQQKNPNVHVDPISSLSRLGFYQTLRDIRDCKIKPKPYIHNNN